MLRDLAKPSWNCNRAVNIRWPAFSSWKHKHLTGWCVKYIHLYISLCHHLKGVTWPIIKNPRVYSPPNSPDPNSIRHAGIRPIHGEAASQPRALKGKSQFWSWRPHGLCSPSPSQVLNQTRIWGNVGFSRLLIPLQSSFSCPAGGTWVRLQSPGIWKQTELCVIHYSDCRAYLIFICAWEVGHTLRRGIQSVWKVFEKINYNDKEETVFLIIWSIVWLNWAGYMTILLIINLFKCTNYMSVSLLRAPSL